MRRDKILSAIGLTEPSDFGEFCNGLGPDKPDEKHEWRDLFIEIENCEKEGLLRVERTGGKIVEIQLTEAGANTIRDRLDAARPLLN